MASTTRHTAHRGRGPGLLTAALTLALALAGCSGVGPVTGSAASPTSVPARQTPAGTPSGVTGPVGKPAADGPLAFSASTLAGPKLDVSTLAGKPVVLWFWAPWCTICRGEAPDVARVAAAFKGRVTFLGVPGLGPVGDMRTFVTSTGTGGFGHLVDADGSLWARFGVVSQPSFVFVGADGSAKTVVGSLDGQALTERVTALAG